MKIKRIAAAVLAAVMVVMTMAMTASADSVFDTAKNVGSGKKVTKTMKNGETMDYKFTPSKKGTATVKVTAKSNTFYIYVNDEDGNEIKYESDISMGRTNTFDYTNHYWSDKSETYKGTIKWDVKAKKTYYIRIKQIGGKGTGKFEASFKYPTSDSSSDDSAFLTCTVKKGGTVQLGSTDADAKWSTSNKSVATVSSKGLIKGVKKGEAIITVKGSSQTLKIKVIVTA